MKSILAILIVIGVFLLIAYVAMQAVNNDQCGTCSSSNSINLYQNWQMYNV